jgi:hypothetical protein
MNGFFLDGVQKETSNFWNILERREQTSKPIVLTEIPDVGQKKKSKTYIF